MRKSSFVLRSAGESTRVRMISVPVNEFLINKAINTGTDKPAHFAEATKAVTIGPGNRSEITLVLKFISTASAASMSLFLCWLGHSNLISQPFQAGSEPITQLRRSSLTLNCCANTPQLLPQGQLATRHSFLLLLFSRGRGRNLLGGVTA
jgi:hypothetical protein